MSFFLTAEDDGGGVSSMTVGLAVLDEASEAGGSGVSRGASGTR